MAPKVTFASSAAAVQQALKDVVERPENDLVRRIDPETGSMKLMSSAAELIQALPGIDPNVLTAWCTMPIFTVRLFVDKKHFDEGGLGRSYAVQAFPLAEPLMKCILWWRRRVTKQNTGFAIFEGGFDMSGPVFLTEPPRLYLDAATGEVEGDDEQEIERKRASHYKRVSMDMRWEGKGVSAELRQKIENAELKVADKKGRGQEYMLKGGWVDRGHGLDISRLNDIQKKFPPQEKKLLSIAAGTILSAR